MNTHEPLNPQPEPVTSKGSAVITRVAGTTASRVIPGTAARPPRPSSAHPRG